MNFFNDDDNDNDFLNYDEQYDSRNYYSLQAEPENFFPDIDSKKELINDETDKRTTEAESKKNTEKVEKVEKAENIEEPKTEDTLIKLKEKENDKQKLIKEEIPININTPINKIINNNSINLIEDKDNDENDKTLLFKLNGLNLTEQDFTNSFNLKELTDKKEEKENSSIVLKKKRGRKSKGDNEGEHNKYSDDNLRRKCKHLVLKYTKEYINEKISSMYDGTYKGMMTKKLLTIKQDQISNATILFNKNFLKKKLKDIFSEEISNRYTNYLSEHNKNLINSLMNDKDENKKEFFCNLFNLRFIDCLEHFRGTSEYFYLNGLITFDEIKNNFDEDKVYLELLTKYIYNYEKIIFNKKERITISDDL